MRGMLCRLAAVAIGLACAILGGPARSDEPDGDQLKKWSKQLHDSLEWYSIAPGRSPNEPAKPEIVLRWGNPVRQQKGETALVFWLDAGRPEALASVYPWIRHLNYECVSLARAGGMVAKEGGRTVWAPRNPGITYKSVPDAPVPARTAAGRLAQMKAIAESFRVAILNVVDGKDNREELRLLPKPVYRYDLGAAKGPHPDLVDGSAFAFVQGTDPEAVLMVEAVRQEDREAWQYGFGRATGWRVEAKLGPAVVWSATDQPSWNDPNQPAILLGRRLQE